MSKVIEMCKEKDKLKLPQLPIVPFSEKTNKDDVVAAKVLRFS